MSEQLTERETVGLLGHNLPKLAELIPEDVVRQLIDAELVPLEKRRDDLIDSCKRFAAAHPVIEDEETDGVAASVLVQCQRFTAKKSGRVDATREALKAPVLAAGRLIDTAFPPLASAVTTASAAVYDASVKYKQKRDARIRAEAEAKAKAAREEAEAAERIARSGSSLVTFEDAGKAYETAAKAQAVADAPAADLTRSRGQDFGTSSLKYKRVVEIIAPAEVPRQYCEPAMALLNRAAGKAGDPTPKIPGCVISDVPDLTVRR